MTSAPASPTPSATPAFAPARTPLGVPVIAERKGLGQRGDRVAVLWLAGGVFAYVVLALLVFASLEGTARGTTRGAVILELVGLGAARNIAVFGLVVIGVLVFVVAALTVAWDIRHMRNEEDDIDFVNAHPDRFDLVLVDGGRRVQLLRRPPDLGAELEGARVETLMDYRVDRVLRARRGGSGIAVSSEEMRVLADRQTSRYGGFARFAASLLLLLAVLGTFAGVKTALPELINALGAPGTAGDGAMPSMVQLQGPLRAVAGAFGGNALALIGAIAVGLMAQGLSFGRRHLLERLEDVSVEYVYGGETVASADPMQAAMASMRDAARVLENAGGALSGIEHALGGLRDEFRRSFSELGTSIADLAARQETGLYDKTTNALTALQARVSDLATAMDTSVKVYGGLVDSVRVRADESRNAVDEMKRANALLASGIDRYVSVADRSERMLAQATQAFTLSQQASERMAAASETTARHVETLAGSVQRIEGVDAALQRVADRVASADEQSRAAWEQSSQRIVGTLDTRLGEVAASLARTGPGPARTGEERAPVPRTEGSADYIALLRRIATQLEQPPPRIPMWRIMAAQVVPALVSVGAGAAGMFLFMHH